MIRSYEIGVLFLPRFFVSFPLFFYFLSFLLFIELNLYFAFKDKEVFNIEEDRFLVPYDLPPTPYDKSGENFIIFYKVFSLFKNTPFCFI